MYYVYRNTAKRSEVIVEFEDKENALEFMACMASRVFDKEVTGYSVRDLLLKECAKVEVNK
jgi:hypothetical protein